MLPSMYEVLDGLVRVLRDFLGDVLPRLGDRWWDTRVLDQLTFRQRQIAEEQEFRSLQDMDLAALLRVLDKNWYEIDGVQHLSRDARNWLKEAQNVRNRWAHRDGNEPTDKDVYRDLDTVCRLEEAIGSDSAVIEQTRVLRDQVMRGMRPAPASSTHQTPVSDSGTYAAGQLVRLKARVDQKGVVVEIITGTPEPRYTVFHGESTTTYYASQLEPVEQASAPQSVDPDTLHAALTAQQLRHPSTRYLYSLYASRIDFVLNRPGISGGCWV